MADKKKILVPDIGDFDKVEVIEVLVAEGDSVEVEQPLITLESEKASMDVPASEAGVVTKLLVSVGDKVGEGDAVVEIEAAKVTDNAGTAENPAASAEKKQEKSEKKEKSTASASKSAEMAALGDVDCDVVVLGSGPGGYTAAFRAADLGLKTVLVERYATLGGVCLNVGCIPSKALLHSAKVIEEAAFMADHGVKFGEPEINIDKLREFKASVVGQLTGGLNGLAKQRKVRVVQGEGRFSGSHELTVSQTGQGEGGEEKIRFAHCIIAAGSESVWLPFLPDDPRVITSTGALALEEIPKTMLVLGGGIIGLEMADVYSALGTTVDVVEMTSGLIPGADRDLIKPFEKKMKAKCRNIWLNTKVTDVKASKKALTVHFEGQKEDKNAPKTEDYERVLVAVGRKPNGNNIGADVVGIDVDERGFVKVDAQQRTSVAHIFAIGDIVGQPMLAHKATHEGKVAAEVIAGHKVKFDARCIPSVVYTDPEVAWTGLTETEAKAQGIAYEKGQFPWAANGRSLGLGNKEGFTKLLFEKDSGRILGGAAVGPNAGELMAEICLAIEMGADMEDIGLTVHAHPTLSETVAMAAEAAHGTLTDLYMPKK